MISSVLYGVHTKVRSNASTTQVGNEQGTHMLSSLLAAFRIVNSARLLRSIMVVYDTVGYDSRRLLQSSQARYSAIVVVAN